MPACPSQEVRYGQIASNHAIQGVPPHHSIGHRTGRLEDELIRFRFFFFFSFFKKQQIYSVDHTQSLYDFHEIRQTQISKSYLMQVRLRILVLQSDCSSLFCAHVVSSFVMMWYLQGDCRIFLYHSGDRPWSYAHIFTSIGLGKGLNLLLIPSELWKQLDNKVPNATRCADSNFVDTLSRRLVLSFLKVSSLILQGSTMIAPGQCGLIRLHSTLTRSGPSRC